MFEWVHNLPVPLMVLVALILIAIGDGLRPR